MARVIDIGRYRTQNWKRKSRSYAAESMRLEGIRRDLERLEAEVRRREREAQGSEIPRRTAAFFSAT